MRKSILVDVVEMHIMKIRMTSNMEVIRVLAFGVNINEVLINSMRISTPSLLEFGVMRLIFDSVGL